jgi:hypothetical protein
MTVEESLLRKILGGVYVGTDHPTKNEPMLCIDTGWFDVTEEEYDLARRLAQEENERLYGAKP